MKKKPLFFTLIIFIIIMILRFIEYFLIRTDETIIGENFIHKVLGIFILYFILCKLNKSNSDLGFSKKEILNNLFKGIFLALVCFTISYLVEYIICLNQNGNAHFEIYAKGFSLTSNEIKNKGFIFIFAIIFLT